MSKQKTYVEWCVSMARTLSDVLFTTENRMVEAMEAGESPYDLPDGIHPADVIAGGVLLVICGMLADESGQSGVLRKAADRLRDAALPEGEDIRSAADAILDAMGAVRTRHRWN